jgi:endonuclease YncB( thermonuclease family)
MSAPPGWFQDPQRPPGHLRWWDGEAWTDQRVAPHDAPVPAAFSPVRWARYHPRMAVAAIAVGLLAIVSAMNSPAQEPGGDDQRRTVNEAGGVADPDAEPERPESFLEDRPVKARPEPAPRTRKRPPRTYLVTKVVDGDTIRLGNGETVRLLGIDAPEAGECGTERAADNLARLVLGKKVRLKAPADDRDRYGRQLRYVDIGSHDAGLRLIKSGLAVPRYDSRDGYGRHPREDLYIVTAKVAPQVTCAPKPKPKPQPLAQPRAGGNCAPGYAPCVPSYPPDVDCPDVDGPITVTGSDPHRLDADDDGIACE